MAQNDDIFEKVEVKILPPGYVILLYEICRRRGLKAGTRFEVEFDEEMGRIYLWPISSDKYFFERPMKGKLKFGPRPRDRV
jgi:hypothetical protein